MQYLPWRTYVPAYLFVNVCVSTLVSTEGLIDTGTYPPTYYLYSSSTNSATEHRPCLSRIRQCISAWPSLQHVSEQQSTCQASVQLGLTKGLPGKAFS